MHPTPRTVTAAAPPTPEGPDWCRRLRDATLFSEYSQAELQEVAGLCRQRFLSRGEVLFVQGDACSAFFLLCSGYIKLYAGRDRRHSKIVEVIEPGETFAEAALFSGQGYPVTAEAIDDSELVAVEGFAFFRFVQQHPHLSWKMLATLSRRAHQLVKQLEALTLLNAEQRVCAYLLEHSDSTAPECMVRHIPPRRADLAGILGLSAETLCRVLSKLKRQGLIEARDSRIVVLDHHALRARLA
jgi:CRP-like cAMP-binding protein